MDAVKKFKSNEMTKKNDKIIKRILETVQRFLGETPYINQFSVSVCEVLQYLTEFEIDYCDLIMIDRPID